jgi:hypothetical protein
MSAEMGNETGKELQGYDTPHELADGETHNASSVLRGALAIPEPDDDNELLVKRERFAVTDFKSASWVVNRIKACRDYIDDVRKWAKAEERKASEAEAFYLRNYGEQLKQLAQDTLQGVNRKYLDLPGARVQLRKQPAKLVVEEEQAVFEWAQENCRDAINHTAAVDLRDATPEQLEELQALINRFGLGIRIDTGIARSGLNNHFKATGEVPPGCTIEGGEDDVYIQ